MKDILQRFINTEQLYNNYYLYKETKWENYFKINLEENFLPLNQQWFGLPYFIVPLNSDNHIFNDKEKKFLVENIFITENDNIFYPFFLHPASVELFRNWIGNKYIFTDETESIFEATPTSSFRTLIVHNKKTDDYFLAKVSIFENVANGSRHIDWNSAVGQYESCQMTKKALESRYKISIFEDIAAFGLTGETPLQLPKKLNIQFGNSEINTFGIVIRKLPAIFYTDSKHSIISFASYMSKKNNYLNIIETKKDILNTCDKTFILPLQNSLINLFSEKGIILEPHCQNLLLEIDEDNIPIGTFFYRDFDMISFDRARYPFYAKEDWLKYISNREDRISLFSNTSMRENIGIGFFIHFYENLIKPFTQFLKMQNLITDEEQSLFLNRRFQEIKNNLYKHIPLMSKLFLHDNSEWNINREYLSKISKIELKDVITNQITELNKDDYIRMLTWYIGEDPIQYYETKNNFIVGFQKEILVEILCK